MWPTVLFLAFSPLLCQGFELLPPCNEPLDMGDECDEEPSIRYHMDAETLTCLAFKYTGCGGNGNNFKSRTHCQLRCIPMDFINCPANTPAVKREDGTSHCDSEHKCPEGSSCVEGFIFGKCCDNEASEKYIADRRPNCGNRQAVKDENRDYPVSCSTFFPKIS
ncbi:Kunitz/Bovine pancreatic trypsin inhibitor domain protein [Oesophagostomum dentatum]|uniref:Kunitz/Bovine pancreatic trypsin inhibitor domain protein n=1 Tax=Oesophagostomum dentatum TaxID=61180 RepID=A0A0B1SM36_OESDE|nr:Kunitz/Bovine pancreatic trypsin inhibitor domain protein [Oesophagostomum dentatum]